MSQTTRLVETIAVCDALGESVLWRDSDDTVWWTDIQGKRVHRITWPVGDVKSWTTPERLCSFGFIANDDRALICAFETGFAVFVPDTGEISWLSKPAELGDGIRLNDGRVDPAGRFWAGSMNERSDTRDGILYRLDANGAAVPVLGDIGISNGLCWSPDAEVAYFSDSRRGILYSAAYNNRVGVWGRLNILLKIENGVPDGAVTDSAGNIWAAIWNGGRVDRISPSGQILESVEVPALQTTCPAFGGPDGNLLFVTSSTEALSDEEREAYPASGSLFVFETRAKGVPATRVRKLPSCASNKQ